MGRAIKINLVEETVVRILDELITQFWKAFPELVPKYLIQAKIINKFDCLYCTTKGGYERQIAKLEDLNLESIVQKELLHGIKLYRDLDSKSRKDFYTPLAVGICNVNEERAREYIHYLIEKEFAAKKKIIKITEVEALVLNKVKPRYAGSRSMLMEMRKDLSNTNDLTHSLVRKAIVAVVENPRRKRQRLTDDGSTEASTIEMKTLGSIKKYLRQNQEVIGFQDQNSLR